MLNSNWNVSLTGFNMPEANHLDFDKQALAKNQQNGSYISKMIQGMDWNDSIGDVGNRLGQEAVPELGSDAAVEGAAANLVNPEVAENNALDSDTKADFSVALADFKQPENQKIGFDENALNRRKENSPKKVAMQMLPMIMGA